MRRYISHVCSFWVGVRACKRVSAGSDIYVLEFHLGGIGGIAVTVTLRSFRHCGYFQDEVALRFVCAILRSYCILCKLPSFDCCCFASDLAGQCARR